MQVSLKSLKQLTTYKFKKTAQKKRKFLIIIDLKC